MARETPSTPAASSTDNPPKNRNFTSSALAESSAAKRIQCVGEVEEVVGRQIVDRDLLTQVESPAAAAALGAGLRTGAVDEDPAHGFGRCGEEVGSAGEQPVPDQSQVRLVHEGGGVEGVAGSFRRHAHGRELPQLVVDEREQVGGSPTVAGRGRVKEAGYIGHDRLSCSSYSLPREGLESAPIYRTSVASTEVAGKQHHRPVPLCTFVILAP